MSKDASAFIPGLAAGDTLPGHVAIPATPAALTASDASVVDATYGAEESAVIANLRTRVNELESALRALGLLA